MNTARVGKVAERRVRDVLISEGYRIITSHLSRGAADLLASKPGQTLAVQVKRLPTSGGGVGVLSWNELWSFAADFNAVPVIAFAPPRQPVTFWRIIGPKDGSGRRQPWVELVLDELAAVDAP